MKPGPRRAAAALLLAGLGALPSGQAAESTVWWRAPAAPEVAWRGMLATEGGAVGMGTQIGPYPAFGVAGLLVAVFTHAAISQSVQSAERQRAQDEADRVLAPYSAALKAWPARELWNAAVGASAAQTPPGPALRILEGPAPAGAGPVLEAAPLFTLAQDEGVLLLDVAVKSVAAPGAAPVEAMVRVVSSPHEAADARAHWAADDARRLKAAAAAMLAQALQLATQHAGATPPADLPMRTHRYLQGGIERTERAQQLAGDCARVVLRNLRGWLLSVPVKPAEGSTCPGERAF